MTITRSQRGLFEKVSKCAVASGPVPGEENTYRIEPMQRESGKTTDWLSHKLATLQLGITRDAGTIAAWERI
jgi:hypothetical protein